MEQQFGAFKNAVEKVFNNWTALRLAVEYGMGGKDGQKTALSLVNYVWEYAIRNDNVDASELQEIIEEIMDQEFGTICDDNSVPEICSILIKYLQLCKENKLNELEGELNELPKAINWLTSGVSIVRQRTDEDSSSSSESEDDLTEKCNESMDVDEAAESCSTSRQENQSEEDPSWTTVKCKKKSSKKN